MNKNIISNYNEIPIGKDQFSFDFIKENKILIIKITEKNLTIAYCKKTKNEVFDLINQLYEKKIKYILVEELDITFWISKILGTNNENINLNNEYDERDINLIANEAPTINLVNSICIGAIKSKASDIHIECDSTKCKVKYRINGDLILIETYPRIKFKAISSRIKIISNLNILEKRLAQDGRTSIEYENKKIDLRVSIVPTKWGESIVLRILGNNNKIRSLNELGFSEKQFNIISEMIKIPHGLILISGPTGSGKTTTLMSIIKKLYNESKKIITIEDPIEICIDGINQIQVNEEIGLSFEECLKRVLRQDPNIIMLGEIRDKETAQLAIRAALTGHLVLSTIHTNDSISSITRLSNMGIENYMIASVLKGTISQRLIKTLDRKKRTIISETIIMDHQLEKLISENKSEFEIRKYLEKIQTEFIKDDSMKKILNKITSIEEVEKEIKL